jgi:hypothetical protein
MKRPVFAEVSILNIKDLLGICRTAHGVLGCVNRAS